MASSTVDVRVEVEAAAARLTDYQRRKLPAAARVSVNTAIRGARTDTKAELKKRISMKVGSIALRIRIEQAKATSTSIKARLYITRRRRGKEFSNLGSFKLQKVRKSVSGKRRLAKAGLGAKVFGETRFKKYRGAFLWERVGSPAGPLPGAVATVFKRKKNAAKAKR